MSEVFLVMSDVFLARSEVFLAMVYPLLRFSEPDSHENSSLISDAGHDMTSH